MQSESKALGHDGFGTSGSPSADFLTAFAKQDLKVFNPHLTLDVGSCDVARLVKSLRELGAWTHRQFTGLDGSIRPASHAFASKNPPLGCRFAAWRFGARFQLNRSG